MSSDTRPATSPQGRAAGHPRSSAVAWRLLLALALALGLVARVVAATRKSLVLDEFHTWFHATRPSLGAFFETLALDNHPPLGFLTVAWARALLGSSELALRSPALLCGLSELALVAWFGTRTLGRWRGLAATALLAASSLHVDFSSQARMYALHSLAALVTLCAGDSLLTGARPSRRAQLALAASLAVAFHTHYYGAYYVLVYGAVAALGAARDRVLRARLTRLVAPVALAALVSLPWLLTGFRAQVAHDLPPGGDDLAFGALGEAFVHLFFLNVRLGGGALRVAFIGGGLLIVLLGLLGALALWRDPRRRQLGLLLAAGAFGVPCLGWSLAHAVPRAGFTWHYVLPSAAPLALLAAVGASEAMAQGVRRASFALALALAATLTVLNVRTTGTEDFRSAVRYLISLHGPGDALVAVEWQPPLFPQSQPFDYYAARVSEAPPPRVACANYTVADPRDLAGATRVLVMSKSLPAQQQLFALLREDFELESTRSFGFALDVQVWRRR